MASLQLDDDDDSDGVVPQRRNQVSQEHEDLVVKGEAFFFFNVRIFDLFCLYEQLITTREKRYT